MVEKCTTTYYCSLSTVPYFSIVYYRTETFSTIKSAAIFLSVRSFYPGTRLGIFLETHGRYLQGVPPGTRERTFLGCSNLKNNYLLQNYVGKFGMWVPNSIEMGTTLYSHTRYLCIYGSIGRQALFRMLYTGHIFAELYNNLEFGPGRQQLLSFC